MRPYIDLPIKVIKSRMAYTQYPSFVTYLVTWRCSYKCIMCDVWKKDQNREEELSLEDIDTIFTQLRRLDAVRLSGGEPFLRSDLPEIIEVVERRVSPRIVHITTNGWDAERIVSAVESFPVLDKIHIKISIDAVGKEHDRIRGVEGAFDRAINTLKELALLRKKKRFFLGVNQTIVDEESIRSYEKLHELTKRFDVPLMAFVAYKNSALYDANKEVVVDPGAGFPTFAPFEGTSLSTMLDVLARDARGINNFFERTVKRYYIKGLKNRLVKGVSLPNPPCTALNTHLRVLPNGDVPVCLYNSRVVGNLKETPFHELWFGNGEKIVEGRHWVSKCKGCWAECEVIPNAVYQGDIWRGLL